MLLSAFFLCDVVIRTLLPEHNFLFYVNASVSQKERKIISGGFFVIKSLLCERCRHPHNNGSQFSWLEKILTVVVYTIHFPFNATPFHLFSQYFPSISVAVKDSMFTFRSLKVLLSGFYFLLPISQSYWRWGSKLGKNLRIIHKSA